MIRTSITIEPEYQSSSPRNPAQYPRVVAPSPPGVGASRLAKKIVAVAALPSAIIAAPVSSDAASLCVGRGGRYGRTFGERRPLWCDICVLAAGGQLKSVYLPVVLFVTRMSPAEDKCRVVCKVGKVRYILDM